MDRRERERIEYRPELKINRDISSEVSQSSFDTQTVSKSYSLPGYDSSFKEIANSGAKTKAVSAYVKYNAGEVVKKAKNLSLLIDNKLQEIQNKLIQEPRYANYPNAIKDKNISWIDTYQEMAENIDGDILAETFPVISSLGEEIRKIIDFINNICFDNKIDWFDLDGEIEKERQKKKHILKMELEGKGVNYKEISIDTQLTKFFQDRVDLLEKFLNDLLNPVMDSPFIMSKEKDIAIDYFDELNTIYQDDKLKLDSFSSTGMLEEILEEIKRLKPKVLANRERLMIAERKEFFSILYIAKVIEDKLTNLIVDLYKFQIADEIYKADYMNSLKLKNSVRESYREI